MRPVHFSGADDSDPQAQARQAQAQAQLAQFQLAQQPVYYHGNATFPSQPPSGFAYPPPAMQAPPQAHLLDPALRPAPVAPAPETSPGPPQKRRRKNNTSNRTSGGSGPKQASTTRRSRKRVKRATEDAMPIDPALHGELEAVDESPEKLEEMLREGNIGELTTMIHSALRVSDDARVARVHRAGTHETDSEDEEEDGPHSSTDEDDSDAE